MKAEPAVAARPEPEVTKVTEVEDKPDITTEVVEEEAVKPEPEVAAKPKPEVAAKPKPKKKRKTLADKVLDKEEAAKAKPKAKKKAKAPVDPTKEAKPKSTKKKTKKDARQDAPEALTQDKNGATKVNDLIAVMKSTDDLEAIKLAWKVYTADIKHGRRKRRSTRLENAYNDRLDELAGEEFKADERPVPSPKKEAKPQPKETEDQAAERMERDMNAEWPWHRDDAIEEEYAYFEKLEGDGLINELFDEITHRWLLTNGIRDDIDPHFIQQVVNEIAEFNPDAIGAADAVYDMLLGEELVDENRQLRLFLTQEYPNALTLKQASGESRSKIAGTPTSVYSRWLELADIAKADAEEARAAALEKMGAPVVTAVQQERKVEVEEDLEAKGEDVLAEAEAELEEVEADEKTKEAFDRLEAALEDRGEDVVEEKETKDYPKFLSALKRDLKTPTLADFKRVFKIGWSVSKSPDVPGMFILTRKSDGMQIGIAFTDVHDEVRRKLETDAKFFKDMAKKHGTRNMDTLVRAVAAKHVAIFNTAKEKGKKQIKKDKGLATGTYHYDAANGMHVITLDSRLADNISLWHESLHVWLRALATDKEVKTVFEVFDTEEEFTGFMAIFANDEDAAMKHAERAGATKSQAGELHSIATRLFDLFKKLAKVLGYKAWVDPKRVAAMQDLYSIAHKLVHGDAFMAPQQRNRYVENELSVGVTKDGGGRVVRRGVVSMVA
ncbi:MAG: hypothetical protein ACYSWO_30165, partial [Planctomycetota bacterium]